VELRRKGEYHLSGFAHQYYIPGNEWNLPARIDYFLSSYAA